MDIRSKLTFALLIAFAAINTSKWGIDCVKNKYHPLDFRTYYTASGVYWQGANPYNIRNIQLYWAKETAQSGWRSLPAFPHSTPVYLPQFVFMFGMYNLTGYETGAMLQCILNLFALLLIAYTISRINADIPYWLSMCAVLAFRGTWYAMDNGQPMLQVAAIMLHALFLILKQNQKILPGILLGFVAYKFTLLIPVALFLMATGRYKSTGIFVFTSLLLNTSAILLNPELMLNLIDMSSNMNSLWTYTHSTFNALSLISSSVSVPLSLLFGLDSNLLKPLMFSLLMLFNAAFVLFEMKNGKVIRILYLTALCGFVFGQHLIYDLLLLIVYRCLSFSKGETPALTEMALLILLIVPLGSIASRFNVDTLNFLVPAFLFVLLCAESIQRAMKYKPAKNAS